METPTNISGSKSLIPRKALFGNPDRVSPQLSPDGKKLSFLPPVGGVLNVWVGPSENPDLGMRPLMERVLSRREILKA